MTEQQAIDNQLHGISCSMSVFGETAERLGLDRELAYRIASGFGGGMGYGSVCGCVTGAYMALGATFGNDPLGRAKAMETLRQKKAEFDKRFSEQFGSLLCSEILEGLNPAVPEERAIIMERGLMQSICPVAICAACEIVAELSE